MTGNKNTQTDDATPMPSNPSAMPDGRGLRVINADRVTKSLTVTVAVRRRKNKAYSPGSTLHSTGDADPTRDQSSSIASRHRFRMAAEGADVRLEGDAAPRRATLRLPQVPAPQRGTFNSLEDEPKMMKDRANFAATRKPAPRGNALRKIVHDAVGDYVTGHKKLPSKLWLERNHNITYYAATRYWPSAGESAVTEVNPAESMPTPRLPKTVNAELVQVIAELVHGSGLVEGTYLTSAGEPMCDALKPEAKGFSPMICEWRRHEQAVRQIIELAIEFTA